MHDELLSDGHDNILGAGILAPLHDLVRWQKRLRLCRTVYIHKLKRAAAVKYAFDEGHRPLSRYEKWNIEPTIKAIYISDYRRKDEKLRVNPSLSTTEQESQDELHRDAAMRIRDELALVEDNDAKLTK